MLFDTYDEICSAARVATLRLPSVTDCCVPLRSDLTEITAKSSSGTTAAAMIRTMSLVVMLRTASAASRGARARGFRP